MEHVKNIRNDALVEAYRAMHANNVKETQEAVTRQMVQATFLIPVLPVKNKLPEDFPPKAIKNEGGQIFLPLFTDIDQAHAAMPGLSEHLLAIDISDVYGYLVDNKELQGAIINPFSKPNLVCVRSIVQNLAKLWSRIKTAEMNGEDSTSAAKANQENVQLLVPKKYPEGAAEMLCASLREQGYISRAWMCVIQKASAENSDTHDWMIVLDTDTTLNGKEDTFREIGQKLTPLLGKQNIIFVQNGEKFEALTRQAPPVYIREDSKS